MIAILIVLALIWPAAAQGAFQPIDLRVDGGEESWHPKRTFIVRWSNPPGTAAVHYRVLDPAGQVAVAETVLDWAATSLQHLSVPPLPGAYTAEVWLEDANGIKGATSVVGLRFDDTPLGQLEPSSVATWIGRTEFPYVLRLGHPTGPAPLSGIRGYAVSIDASPQGGACLTAAACGASETELQGGVGADSVSIPELPEGANYLHATAVSGSGTRSTTPATTILRVDKTDPVTRLAGDGGGWSNRPLTLTATAVDEASGMAASANGGQPYTAIRVDGGTPATAAGNSVTIALIASGIHTIAYYARDAAGNVADGGVANGRSNHEPATALVRIDREPPQLVFESAQNPLDPERIEARTTDSLSGIDPTLGAIAVRRAGSGERFVVLPTDRSGALLRARWDSESYPSGEYEFRATAYDLAGNSASTLSRDSGKAMRLSNPLKVQTTLVGKLSSHSVSYGRSASFSGRLVAGRRTGLAGVPVRVIERFDAGAVPRERVVTVRTGAGGDFDLRLSSGPSRELLAVAPPTATLRGASARPLRLSVRGGLRMRVSSTIARVGGGPVVFSGSVAGGRDTIPADGKVVQLQFRLPNLPWSEFRTVRTDRLGRFRYPYRFADDDSRGVRFWFRAFAPTQAGWPFEPAGSAPVTVLGR